MSKLRKTIEIPHAFQHECNYVHEEVTDGIYYWAFIKIIEDEGRCWATIESAYAWDDAENKEVECDFETEFEK